MVCSPCARPHESGENDRNISLASNPFVFQRSTDGERRRAEFSYIYSLWRMPPARAEPGPFRGVLVQRALVISVTTLRSGVRHQFKTPPSADAMLAPTLGVEACFS